MQIDISIALMKIITAVIVTKSMPNPNFSLSFAIRRENSPTEIIAMLEKNGCSFLKLANKNVRNPIAINLEMNTAMSNADIMPIFGLTVEKSTKVPIDIKNIDVKIEA